MINPTNPYSAWIARFDAWAAEGRDLPLGGIKIPPRPAVPESAPKMLLFSPHPDDECIIGALPLRLAQEAGLHVINIAVTLGSNMARQAARWTELENACAFLGWGLECTEPEGLSRITPKAREEDPQHWQAAVACIRRILERHQPRLIAFPHSADWNGTHLGTHLLLMDALAAMPGRFCCGLIETEFWGAMATPNLMVESSSKDIADLIAALSFHVGEVQRNPYHLTLPAWMQDNVRRGGEIVGGQGGAAPDYRFATLYRASIWRDGACCLPSGTGRFLPANAQAILQWLESLAWK